MSQRNHDPTEQGMPVYSTTGTLRETLEQLDGDEFIIEVAFGGEPDGSQTIQSG